LNQGLELNGERKSEGHYKGPTQQGVIIRQLDYAFAYDTHILRLTLRQPGQKEPAEWRNLRLAMDNMVMGFWRDNQNYPFPWAGSYLYHAQIPDRGDFEEYLHNPHGIEFDVSVERHDKTYTGFLWFEPRRETEFYEDKKFWQRQVILLSPTEQAKQYAEQDLLAESLKFGLARCELYFHKAQHHSGEYDKLSASLKAQRTVLREEMGKALQTTDRTQIDQESLELENLGQHLIDLLIYKEGADSLKASIEANITSFEKNVKTAKLKGQAKRYEAQLHDCSQILAQIEHDLLYVKSTEENVKSILSVDRELTMMRMEHTNFLTSIAIALLTIVFVFDGFLEIWGFLLKEGATQPAPIYRALVAGLASLASLILLIGIGPKTYWNFAKRHWQAVVLFLALFGWAIALAYIWTG
jgi:hypothetical protein